MNFCKACEQSYFSMANKMDEDGGPCQKTNKKHVAKYNFEKDEDVMKCEVWYLIF